MSTLVRYRLSFFAIIVLLHTLSQIHANTNLTIEDDFNYQFGNLSDYRFWTDARVWYVDNDEPVLKEFCATAHFQAGKGSYKVDWLILRQRTLQFRNHRYLTRGLDVVEYSIVVEGATTPVMDGTTRAEKLKLAGKTWAITEGRQKDCVYYLNLDNVTKSDRIFSLKEEVCGIANSPTPASRYL